MMFRGETQILHTRFLSCIQPGSRVEFLRVELIDQLGIMDPWNPIAHLLLFMPGMDVIQAPMQKKSQVFRKKPVAAVAEFVYLLC